ncbi:MULTISPECIES: AraC family ligand binding domain-containing protein [unclassified Leptolyngbya]|uniref:AraC family ligand binding domain-containing protein n=1 Tax=unclassified Leptolyngbya TaxID=2650499 RepID=UPI0016865516|nr:AraC family transcriptional regulator [Leptolyngbya sp. FACHB-8]MBD2158225.1 AraC family transcriptional regulator [Leptolyngbya sp. FACHB-16]
MADRSHKESVKFWKDPLLPQVELLRATYITHSFARHTHDGYALGVIERGQEGFQYRGASYVAPAGSIALIHPGEVHTGHAAEASGWTYRMFYPDASVLGEVANQLAGHPVTLPYFPNPVIHDPVLVRELSGVHQALEQGASQLEWESRLLWVLAQLIARYGSDRPIPRSISPDPQRMAQVRDYLATHLNESVSLDDLAAFAQMQPFRLLRTFRAQFGLPPHAYQNQLRLYYAKRLIAHGVPLVQVAIDSGFTDQSHLNRHFKRIFGVTPGQYQRGCKNVQEFSRLPSLS